MKGGPLSHREPPSQARARGRKKLGRNRPLLIIRADGYLGSRQFIRRTPLYSLGKTALLAIVHCSYPCLGDETEKKTQRLTAGKKVSLIDYWNRRYGGLSANALLRLFGVPESGCFVTKLI
jgi:hypothetical protein